MLLMAVPVFVMTVQVKEAKATGPVFKNLIPGAVVQAD